MRINIYLLRLSSNDRNWKFIIDFLVNNIPTRRSQRYANNKRMVESQKMLKNSKKTYKSIGFTLVCIDHHHHYRHQIGCLVAFDRYG